MAIKLVECCCLLFVVDVDSYC